VARERLSEDAIQGQLDGVDWEREDGEIRKTVVLADFKEAMEFVNRVADLAEARNHHPDITISWNKVGLVLSTHDAGGLTALDFELARSIDELRE
jgi:4a-hydroxytetrahydrobiopterin dehydratase